MYKFYIKKSGDQSANPMKVRGAVREKSGYIKRVVTGTDKDGSPQYRYIRTQAELKAWEENQAKESPSKKKKKKDVVTLKEKVAKEHKKYTLLSRKSPKKDDDSDEKTEKSLTIKVRP